jgi:hypothetical protein
MMKAQHNECRRFRAKLKPLENVLERHLSCILNTSNFTLPHMTCSRKLQEFMAHRFGIKADSTWVARNSYLQRNVRIFP